MALIPASASAMTGCGRAEPCPNCCPARMILYGEDGAPGFLNMPNVFSIV